MDDGSTPEMRYVKSQIKFLTQETHGLELQVDGNYEALSESIHDLEGFLRQVDKRLDRYEQAMVHLLECHIPEPAFRYFQLPPDCANKRCNLYSSTPPPYSPSSPATTRVTVRFLCFVYCRKLYTTVVL
jgi:hypothetical protein